MKQQEVSKWLKGITITIALMGIVFFFMIMPKLAYDFQMEYPDMKKYYWPGLIYGWLIAVGCYAILYQFWKVCIEIGKDNSFSKETAGAFVNISKIAFALVFIWFAGLGALAVSHIANAGSVIFLIFAMLISIIIAILAAALSHLILKAYDLKQETDLTI